MRRGAVAIALAVALLVAAVQVQAARERLSPAPAETGESLYLKSGEALRHLTVSLHALASDLYWIRAIQHYGGTKRRLTDTFAPPPAASSTSTSYELLYPLLDITTSLDPRFKIAYRFGAVFLAEAWPNGPGRPDLAVQLLEKGLRAQPDRWEYMQDIGFVHYWYHHDYKAAAASFQRAGDVPGAPWWLRSLAATTLAQGGDRRSSRTMWLAIRESAEIDWLRRDAERRLLQLDALDQIEQIQRILDQGSVLRNAPLDPAGVPYEIAGGRVRLSQKSPLWPPPEEPERLPQSPS